MGIMSNPVTKHRRDVWLRIIAPVALPAIGLAVLCAALVAAVATDAMVSQRITVLMSFLATLFIAVPAVILCVVPYALLAFTATAAGIAYAHATGPLRAARGLTERVALKTDQLAPRLAQPFASLNVKVTRWEHTLKQWQSLPEQESANPQEITGKTIYDQRSTTKN